MLNALETLESQENAFDVSVQFVGTQQEVSDQDEPDEKYKLALKQNFGHDHFRPLQWRIIKSILIDKRYVGRL